MARGVVDVPQPYLMLKNVRARATQRLQQLGPHQMSKDIMTPEIPHREERDSLQCQYPGQCTSERTLKRNGERHWLCAEHRDHQNALQRDRYRRVTKKKKEKASKRAPSSNPRETKREKRPRHGERPMHVAASTSREKKRGKKGSRVEKSKSSAVLPTRPVHLASTSASDPSTDQGELLRMNNHPRTVGEDLPRTAASDTASHSTTIQAEQPTTRNHLRAATEDAPHTAVLHRVGGLGTAQDAHVAVRAQSLPCVQHGAAAMQSPQVIYIVVQAIPMTLSAAHQLTAAQQLSSNSCSCTSGRGEYTAVGVPGDLGSAAGSIVAGQPFLMPVSRAQQAPLPVPLTFAVPPASVPSFHDDAEAEA
ncbi:hypothetical protein PF004_g6810 [Phytophthora fragariae]|nr:hypothetical protein PF004_g6810 [Phytophthora fragariae]